MQGFHVSPGEFDESAVLHVDVMPLQVSVLIGEAFPAEVRQEMKITVLDTCEPKDRFCACGRKCSPQMKVCVGELGHKLIFLPVDVACPPFNSNEQIIWLSTLRVDHHSTTLALVGMLSQLS